MSNNDPGTAVAKELISLVIANVRKGAPKTGAINSRASTQKKKRTAVRPAAVEIVAATPEEVTEQLRKFENMVIIQRLDSLIDMQKMQWEILDRISGLLETLNLVVGERPQPDSEDDPPNSTEALEEMIRAQENSKATAVDDPYDKAEALARKIVKVKNEIN